MAIDAVATRESMAGHYVTLCTYASLHTGDPAGTGANEVTGGTPAYARKPLTWTAGAVDGTYVSDPVTIDVPAATTITHVGLWDAATAGNYRDKRTFNITFASQGTVTLTITYSQS